MFHTIEGNCSPPPQTSAWLSTGVIRQPILCFLTHLTIMLTEALHGLTLGSPWACEEASWVLIAGGHQLIKDRAQEARGGRGRGV